MKNDSKAEFRYELKELIDMYDEVFRKEELESTRLLDIDERVNKARKDINKILDGIIENTN